MFEQLKKMTGVESLAEMVLYIYAYIHACAYVFIYAYIYIPYIHTSINTCIRTYTFRTTILAKACILTIGFELYHARRGNVFTLQFHSNGKIAVVYEK